MEGIIATGTDNLDLEVCRRHGVAVANVPGYSTYSVAQMTFSLLLAICQCAERYNRAMKAGHWQLDIPAEYGLLPQMELLDKTFGVYGYGSIGRQTARIARAFGMKVLPVAPADAGKTVAQLLGEVETRSPRTLVLEPGAYPSALVLANFKDKDVDTLLDLMKQAQVNIPLKAVVTPTNRNWVFGDLLAHLQEEHTAFTAAKENQTR